MRIVYTVTEAPEKPRRRLSPEARREIVRRLGAGAAVQALAVDEGHSDLNFCGLAVRVSGGDAFAKGFQAAHLGLDAAAGVVSGPALPECPAVVPGGTQGFAAADTATNGDFRDNLPRLGDPQCDVLCRSGLTDPQPNPQAGRSTHCQPDLGAP